MQALGRTRYTRRARSPLRKFAVRPWGANQAGPRWRYRRKDRRGQSFIWQNRKVALYCACTLPQLLVRLTKG